MPRMGEYRLEDLLHDGQNSRVYRAVRDGDGARVVVKLPRPGRHTAARRVRLQREYELLQQFDDVGVLKALGLESLGEQLALVLEDFGGTSLRERAHGDAPMELGEFFRLALRITAGLAAIHARGVVHRDIKPSNILVNPESGRVAIADFSISSQLTRERQGLTGASDLEGTLAYMSPEQTGRMNRSVDYRSDYYSLGVSFYQLLTCTLPFSAVDAGELVHAHIAVAPEPPSARRPELPQAVSDIVLKLMAKTAEQRYQSARGISADLERCLAEWEERGAIEGFTPGEHDLSERFQIPERLYGRERELVRLEACFERCAAGGVELTLIAGAPGIGKSALVSELLRSISARRGMFGAGKFDQLAGGTPHAGLTNAIRDLSRQLLTESESVIARWRARLRPALGRDQPALTALVPELSRLLDDGERGEHDESEGASAPSGAEASDRLRRALAHALQTFASDEHPLVLFLDDLQWAEPTTLTLLERLVSSPGLSNLLILGAYRDNEVDEKHPLRTSLQRLRARGVPIARCELGPLTREDVTALTRDTVDPAAGSEAAVPALAGFLHDLTGGNPFFLQVALRSLHERGLLRFDHVLQGWSWELDALRRAELSDDLGVVMSTRLHELPDSVRELLELAACIGNDFNLDLLSLSLDRDPAAVADGLLEAVRKGLVRPVGNAYKYVDRDAQGSTRAGEGGAREVRYRFQHDRIQQAAYALIPEASLPAVHLKTGRLLLERGLDSSDELLFTLTQHLNHAIPLIDDPDERLRLAEYNLRAGRRAQRSSAWELARAHYCQGIELLPEDRWGAAHELTYSLLLALAEVTVQEATSEGLNSARGIITVLKRHARTLLERVRLSDISFSIGMQSARYDESLRAAQEGLVELGYAAPRSGAAPIVLRELALAQWRLHRLDLARYLSRPRLDDPEHELAMRMYIYVWQMAQHVDDSLGPVALLRIANETLRRGLSDYTTLGLAGLATILISGFGAFKQGVRIGELAIELALQGGNAHADATALTYLGTSVAPWGRPLAEANELLTHAHERAASAALPMEQHGYAAWDGLVRWFRGVPLEDLREFSGARLDEALHYFMDAPGSVSQLVFADRCARALMGDTRAPFDMSSETWSEHEYLATLRDAGTAIFLALHALLRAQLATIAGDFEAARRWIEALRRHDTPATRNSLIGQRRDFIAGLSAAALATDAPSSRRRALVRELRRATRSTARAAELRADNFLGHHLLLEAERARLAGHHGRARGRYDEAIEHARAQRDLRLEALALERAARCAFAAGHELIGEMYIRSCRRTYERWGALVKVERLTEEFSAYFTRARAGQPTSVLGTPSSSSSLNDTIDLKALLKASRAISGELVLERLLRQLLVIVLENAGAQRGALLLINAAGELRVEAECDLERGPEGVRTLESRAPGERECQAIIDYVARTRDEVVLDDATHAGDFTGDPYILEHRPRSLLCTPILHHGALQGALYLENRLTAAVFTKPRLVLLTQLAAQIAISIENARLYETLDAARDRAVAADRAKSRFLLTMSHELRTPLNAVIGYTDLVEEDLEDEDMEAVQEDLDRIRQGARRLVRTLTSILELSRLESEDVTPSRGQVELDPLLREIIAECAPLATQHGDELSYSLEAGAPATIWSDVQMTRYVLFSVIDNACKYTKQGRVTCRARACTRDTTPGVEFGVADTGIGIAAEAHERIFAAFAQADEGTSRQFEGSGISLAVARRFCRLQGGDVTVESEPGAGATFTIWLPLGREALH